MDNAQGFKGSRVQVNALSLFLLLLLLVFITRFPFHTKILYDWDSVQFALGMRHFDVSLFQPHPPGYFFYVMSARAVNFFVHDENTSLVLLSILGSAVALYFTFLLGLRMFSKEVAVASTALLFTSPLFWMFGLIGNPDIFDAAFSAWFAYLAWRILKGERNLLPWASLLLGISTGFRTGLLIFLGPLWLYILIKSSSGKFFKNFLLSGIIVSLCICAWLIPSAYLSHGMKSYMESFKQSSASFIETSVFRAGFDGISMNMCMFVMSLVFGGLCFFSLHLWLFPVISLNVGKMKKRNAELISKYGKNSIKHWTESSKDAALFYYGSFQNFLFYVAWLLPATLFLCFIHDRTPAFALFFLPAVFLQTAHLAFSFYKDFHSAAKAKISAGLFFAPFIAVFFLLNTWVCTTLDSEFIHSMNNDWTLREKYIKSHLDKNKTLLVTSFYTLCCNDLYPNWYRHAMYYLPDYRIYFIPEVFNKKSSKTAQEAFHYNARKLQFSIEEDVYKIPLPVGVSDVVFLEDYLYDAYRASPDFDKKNVQKYLVSRKPAILLYGVSLRRGENYLTLKSIKHFYDKLKY